MEHKAVGPLGCNCTLLGNTETGEAYVVDPGGEPDWILGWLKRRHLKLKGVLHTHAHFDHFWASGQLRESTQAPLALHKKDEFLWKLFPMQCSLFGAPAPTGPMPPPDTWLEHDQPVELGDLHGKVLHTPGHSPGSCCFHFEPLKLLLAGDTLFRRGIGRTDLWGGDSKAIERSIKNKLFKTLDEATDVIPGHGPNTTLREEMERNPYVGLGA